MRKLSLFPWKLSSHEKLSKYLGSLQRSIATVFLLWITTTCHRHKTNPTYQIQLSEL